MSPQLGMLERETVNLKIGSPSPPGGATSRSVTGLRAVMVVAPRISRWSHITPKLQINQQERSTAQWRKRKQTKAKNHDKQQEIGRRRKYKKLENIEKAVLIPDDQLQGGSYGAI